MTQSGRIGVRDTQKYKLFSSREPPGKGSILSPLCRRGFDCVTQPVGSEGTLILATFKRASVHRSN